MLYFKNTELAESQHVSLRTVLNWIEAAKEGKLELELHDTNGKTHVANTARNLQTIAHLVEDRRKYRNKRGLKTVSPLPEFYDLYSEQQVFDIISSLDLYNEIPYQYSYFGGGVDYWDEFSYRKTQETAPNDLTATWGLLQQSYAYLDNLLSTYSRVNIVDLGPGNGLPAKELLAHLVQQGKMGNYIGIDISASMLGVAERNIAEWFDGQVPFKGYVRDIHYDRFADIIAGEHIRSTNKTVNLVLLAGGTVNNLRSPDAALRLIHDSMGRDDLFLYSLRLDSAASRQYFDFHTSPANTVLTQGQRFVPDLLQIDESLYDVAMGYNPAMHQRYVRIQLKVALTIAFTFNHGQRHIHFNKGESILLLRMKHQTPSEVIQQFSRNKFSTLQMSLTNSEEFMLSISRINREVE